MAESNPYAAPQQPSAPSYGNADTTDIFVDTLATPRVRAAGIAAIITGVATLFVCLQLVIATRGPVALALEAVMAAIGVAHFGVAWGIASGRAWTAIGGMFLAVFSGLLLAFTFLMSGALSCLMAAAGALTTLIFLAMNLGAIRKMGRARAAMDRATG
jgi:hypothetical protein